MKEKMNSDAGQRVKKFYAPYKLKAYKKGEVILWPDAEALPPVSLIEDGAIAQYDITDNGDKVVVNIFKKGAFFPVSSAINHRPNQYYFEAMTTSTIRQAPPKDVELFLQNNPSVTYDLLQRVYHGTDGMIGRLALLLNGTASARLLHELHILGDRFGVRLPNGTLEIEITSAEIAQQTGLARETVSRELKLLKEQQIVTVSRGKIILLPRIKD